MGRSYNAACGCVFFARKQVGLSNAKPNVECEMLLGFTAFSPTYLLSDLEGNVMRRYASADTPEKIEKDILKLL